MGVCGSTWRGSAAATWRRRAPSEGGYWMKSRRSRATTAKPSSGRWGPGRPPARGGRAVGQAATLWAGRRGGRRSAVGGGRPDWGQAPAALRRRAPGAADESWRNSSWPPPPPGSSGRSVPRPLQCLLTPARRTVARRGRGTTQPGELAQQQIPIRTFAEWNDAQPGFLEVDLVAGPLWPSRRRLLPAYPLRR